MREWQGSSTRWYTESTLKSDTEPAIIAFRNRAAKNCKAEVALKDAVKEDKLSNGLVENAVMLMRGVIRTIKCYVESCTQEELWEDSPILPWLVEHAGSMLSRCQKGRDGRTPLERLHGKKPTQEFMPFGEKVLTRPISSEPLNRMNPRYKFGAWLGVRNNSAECFAATAEGVFRAREVSRIEHQDRWDKEAINNVIGVPWRIVDGNWIVDRPATHIDPLPPPPVPFEGARVQRREQTLRASVPLQDARVAMRSNLDSKRKLTQTFDEPGLRNVSKQLQKEQNVQIEEARC